MAFDPSLCGFSSVTTATTTSESFKNSDDSFTPLKRKLELESICDVSEHNASNTDHKHRENPNMWCGESGVTAQLSLPYLPRSIPTIDPRMIIPATEQASCQLWMPSESYSLPHVHHLKDHIDDPRRHNFPCKSKAFPLAGLLREDGGIYGFLDACRTYSKRHGTA